MAWTRKTESVMHHHGSTTSSHAPGILVKY